MHICNRKLWVKIVAICLLITLVIPHPANAAVVDPIQPMASNYLTSYNTYIYPAGNGKIQVWFSVTGVEYMDDIGTLSIRLYESTDNSTWTHVKTFSHANYSSMLAQNKIRHTDCVNYQGVTGRYYKAYVGIWAGKDGGGDTRYMWTLAKRAT